MHKLVKNGLLKGIAPMVKQMRMVSVCLAALMTFGIAHANESEGLAAANTSLSNMASLQNGAKLFFNYCAGCHSLKYMRYSRIAEDLGLTEQQVMENINFTGVKFGETVQSNMSAADAEKWFGKAPPDLSLEARSKGTDWIFNYLKSFYVDPNRPMGWNNTVFPNASMPNVLWELSGSQSARFVEKIAGHEKDKSGKDILECPHGMPEIEGRCFEKFESVANGRQNAEQFDQTARDITAFLQYVGEPAALKRQAMGAWVLLYLAAFTFIAWLLKHEYWKDVH